MLDVYLVGELNPSAGRMLLLVAGLILELAAGDGELFWGTEKTLDVLDWCCGLVMWLDLGS